MKKKSFIVAIGLILNVGLVSANELRAITLPDCDIYMQLYVGPDKEWQIKNAYTQKKCSISAARFVDVMQAAGSQKPVVAIVNRSFYPQVESNGNFASGNTQPVRVSFSGGRLPISIFRGLSICRPKPCSNT